MNPDIGLHRQTVPAKPIAMIAGAKPAFTRHGPEQPQSPVIISVPHAGRRYPEDLYLRTHLSADQLLPLEDRYADLLVEKLLNGRHTIFVAHTPRAWIDLNRDERDVDPAMITPPPRHGFALSTKARGGLGLIPRRTAGLGEIWRTPLSPQELELRVSRHHRPWHAALAEALAAAADRFGAAVLIDLHSMPSLQPSMRTGAPQIVVGDRFGRSCHGRFAARVAGLAEREGLIPAFNAPYAGGYILDRHGRPQEDRHAVQVEVDRALYLAPNLRDPGPGLATMQHFVANLANALAEEIMATALPLAAE